jgi:MFS family permease
LIDSLIRYNFLIIPNSRLKVKKSLKLSVLDGSAYAAMLGLTFNYITPFALALKATTAQVGLLTSIPNLIMAVSQLAAPDLAERAGSRKGLILPVVFLHALMFIPILLIPFVLPSGQVWWCIGFVTLNTVLGALANPAWGSMMADLVPPSLRGRYFSFRGRVTGIITFVFSLIGGGILQVFTGSILTGFAILFGAAAVFRLVSLYFLAGMYEPLDPSQKKNGPGLFELIGKMRSSNLGKFTIFVALISFTTNLANPFFAVFMLKDLNFSYTTYMVVISFSAISNLLFQTFWGSRADRTGNMLAVKISSSFLPLVPLLWIFNHNVLFLIFIQIISGFALSGFNLATVNFVYDAAEPGTRTKQIAVFNAINGIAICLGALSGGFLVAYLPAILGTDFHTLFLVSGVACALVVVLFLRQIHEVRSVPWVSPFQFFIRR